MVKISQLLLGLSAVAAAVASPVLENRALGPSVTLKNGTVVGSSLAGVDSFLGIPFALPPVGDLRLRRPAAYEKSFGTLQATRYAPGCIQSFGGINTSALPGQATSLLLNNPFTNAVLSQSEDCLYLNVQRPSTAKPGAKLPVVIWIYGGGFEFGATNTYNAAPIVSRASQLGADFIYVSMAYRLNGYGFLAGKEVKNDGSSNLGLHDQRLAFMWVQENIAAFGGDPDHVVIWGESAGSISVFDHTIINNGDNKYKGKAMFHGAVMNSGSVVPTRDVDSPKAQAVYDQVVQAAGCNTQSDTLACLRKLPTDKLSAAFNAPPGIFGYESLSLSYLPRPDPSSSFFPTSPENVATEVNSTNGGFVAIPIIVGDQEDEGALFSLTQSNLTTNDNVIDYLNNVFFPGTPRDTVAALVNAYPEDITQGSPFRSGILNNIYPQYKRLAAILGDITFTLTRRAYLEVASTKIPTWSYLNSFLFGTPVLGTFHAADLVVLYGTLPTTIQSPQQPIDYYISFFNFLDPNKLFQAQHASGTTAGANKSTASVAWPQWRSDSRQLINFNALNTAIITDDFRSAQYAALQNAKGKLQA